MGILFVVNLVLTSGNPRLLKEKKKLRADAQDMSGESAKVRSIVVALQAL
jgi:hypothetical protein